MLAIIAAKSKNNVIGFEGKMPWKQRNDLQRFKALTYGHTVIMGRKTLESMNHKALPDRANIVLTRDIIKFLESLPPSLNRGHHFTTMSDFDNAVELYTRHQFPYRMHLPTGFIIGGSELYKLGMDHANLMFITELDCEVEGDAFFPEIDPLKWKKVSVEHYKKDENNQYDYSFVTYARIVPEPDPGHLVPS